MIVDIFVVPIEKLIKIHPELNEIFFRNIIQQEPRMGVERETCFILNNNLTVRANIDLPVLNIFNNFVMLSRNKCKAIQILKTKQNEHTTP